MQKKLVITTLILAWLCANGVIGNVVHVVAWSCTVASHFKCSAPVASLKQALEDEPCAKLVTTLQSTQAPARSNAPFPCSSKSAPERKLVLSCDRFVPLVIAGPEPPWPPTADPFGEVRPDAPPLPPPRA